MYTFSKNGARKVSGTYAGDWLKGSFHGLGTLTYTDGEMYIGEPCASTCPALRSGKPASGRAGLLSRCAADEASCALASIRALGQR